MDTSTKKRRLTSFRQAAIRLGESTYGVQKLAIVGILTAELVDDRPFITIESIERREQEIAERQSVAA
jgi:hypothetical protein